MNSRNILPALILFFSATILIGAGHGLGFMILAELVLIPEFIDYLMQGQSGFEDSLIIAGIIFFFGQLFLTFSIFKKNHGAILYQFTGIIALLIGFIVLIYPLDAANQKLSFYSGIPMLICMMIFLIRHFITKKESA